MGVPQSFLGRGSYREDQLVGECAAEVKRILVSVRCASCYSWRTSRDSSQQSSHRPKRHVSCASGRRGPKAHSEQTSWKSTAMIRRGQRNALLRCVFVLSAAQSACRGQNNQKRLKEFQIQYEHARRLVITMEAWALSCRNYFTPASLPCALWSSQPCTACIVGPYQDISRPCSSFPQSIPSNETT